MRLGTGNVHAKLSAPISDETPGRCVLLRLTLFGLLAALPLAGCARKRSAPPIRPRPGYAWTGSELLLWDGENGYALDPEKNEWRRMANNPYYVHSSAPHSQPRLLWLRGGKALAAYWLSGDRPRLCFDHYLPEKDTWERVGAITQEELRAHTGNGRLAPLIAGMAEVKQGAVVLVCPVEPHSKVIGIKVGGNGSIRLLSTHNAPTAGVSGVVVCGPESEVLFYSRAAVHGWEARVLYLGHDGEGHTTWSVWEESTDTWQRPQEFAEIDDFGHCSAGDRVYIFGGSYMHGRWLRSSGWIYSFEGNSWREFPVPQGRRDVAMCWTGKEILVWGGDLGASDIGPAWLRAPGGAVFSGAGRHIRPMPLTSEPPRRCGCVCVWTGKEMIIWGGETQDLRWQHDCYAFDPEKVVPCKKGVWRRLADLPASGGE